MTKELIPFFEPNHPLPKPEFPEGASLEARREAWQTLADYHSHNFGKEDSFEVSWHLRGFGQILIDNPPLLPEYQLRAALGIVRRELREQEKAFVGRARELAGKLGTNELLGSTCPYRRVDGLVEGMVTFTLNNSQALTFPIAGVGSSGGHEYLVIQKDYQRGILAEFIREALIVADVSVIGRKITNEDIARMAQEMIGERLKRVFAASPNCLEFGQMAREGAEQLIKQKRLKGTKPINDYEVCLMRRSSTGFNPGLKESYERQGLYPPIPRGRLDCLSACGETYARIRAIEAVNLALALPETVSNINYIFQTTTQTINSQPATGYIYLSLDPLNQKPPEVKTLILTRELSYNPLQKNQARPPFWIARAIEKRASSEQKRIIEAANKVVIYKGGLNIIVGVGKSEKEVESPEFKFVPGEDEKVLTIPQVLIALFPDFSVHNLNLYTIGFPCEYCVGHFSNLS